VRTIDGRRIARAHIRRLAWHPAVAVVLAIASVVVEGEATCWARCWALDFARERGYSSGDRRYEDC